jgi:hypothetical protein
MLDPLRGSSHKKLSPHEPIYWKQADQVDVCRSVAPPCPSSLVACANIKTTTTLASWFLQWFRAHPTHPGKECRRTYMHARAWTLDFPEVQRSREHAHVDIPRRTESSRLCILERPFNPPMVKFVSEKESGHMHGCACALTMRLAHTHDGLHRLLKDYPHRLDLSAFGLQDVDPNEKFPVGAEFTMTNKQSWSVNEVRRHTPKPHARIASNVFCPAASVYMVPQKRGNTRLWPSKFGLCVFILRAPCMRA